MSILEWFNQYSPDITDAINKEELDLDVPRVQGGAAVDSMVIYYLLLVKIVLVIVVFILCNRNRRNRRRFRIHWA
ncbi:hypothetical protein [Hyptis latent virus]|uniref:Uncharacterized protein n=1 Tax=Hyptis latent virus TaxID=2963947 RepID=A0AAE9MRI0_9RHAB|nr:hypothetical protein [Hyptis latent virus]